jgi:hypothetical protein
MAGDWIKMNKSLPRDPRVVRISSALKADRLRTVGGLLSAWCLADELTSDGNLDAYTPELLDELIGLPGLARQMEAVGWLVIGDGFLEFPRFDEHNGQSAKRRAQDNARKMSARKADKCPHEKRTKSGPEKRREENISKEIKAAPCTIEQAISAGSNHGMTPEQVNRWFDKRDADGWMVHRNNGTMTEVTNWQKDLATAKSWRGEKSGYGVESSKSLTQRAAQTVAAEKASGQYREEAF